MKQIVSALNLSYKINEKKLFQNISFDVSTGSAIHIQGANGSGKTTLLKIITVSYTHLTLPTKRIV